MIVTPYYNRPTISGLSAHYRAILDAVPLDAMVYNVPSRTGYDLKPDALERLLEDGRIQAIKEASGNASRIKELASRFSEDLAILSGDDGIALEAFEAGAVGLVSVTANLLPGQVTQVWERFKAGHTETSRALHDALRPVHEALFIETNPGPVKAALARFGHIRAEVRLPLALPSTAVTGGIATVVERAGFAAEARAGHRTSFRGAETGSIARPIDGQTTEPRSAPTLGAFELDWTDEEFSFLADESRFQALAELA